MLSKKEDNENKIWYYLFCISKWTIYLQINGGNKEFDQNSDFNDQYEMKKNCLLQTK